MQLSKFCACVAVAGGAALSLATGAGLARLSRHEAIVCGLAEEPAASMSEPIPFRPPAAPSERADRLRLDEQWLLRRRTAERKAMREFDTRLRAQQQVLDRMLKHDPSARRQMQRMQAQMRRREVMRLAQKLRDLQREPQPRELQPRERAARPGPTRDLLFRDEDRKDFKAAHPFLLSPEGRVEAVLPRAR